MNRKSPSPPPDNCPAKAPRAAAVRRSAKRRTRDTGRPSDEPLHRSVDPEIEIGSPEWWAAIAAEDARRNAGRPRTYRPPAVRPWDYRLAAAAERFLVWLGPVRLAMWAGRSCKVIVAWGVSFVFHVWRGRVPAITAAWRLATCRTCPDCVALQRRTLPLRRPYVGRYCMRHGGCSSVLPCPRTRLSRLEVKTQLHNFECPIGRFPAGPRPEEEEANDGLENVDWRGR